MNFIYCFTNLINQKKYIGSSCSINPQRRYSQHLYHVNHPDSPKGQYPLYCAIRKYGLENFSYTILEYLPDNMDEYTVREKEKEYLIKYNVLVPNGYNQTLDTQHPRNDPSTYKKMSETKRNNAKKVAEIDKNNKVIKIWRCIADCAEQEHLNEKHIAACCRGERHYTNNRRFCWINNNKLLLPTYTGTQYKGLPGSTQIQSSSRKVLKLDDDNNILAEYPTLALAARENNCDSSGISKVCKGIRNKCGGFKWKYGE